MKRAAAFLMLSMGVAVEAAPAQAPHCNFVRDPVVVCYDPDRAAAAWHVYGFDMGAVKDSNNRALLARTGCFAIDHDAARHPVLLDREGRVPTRWGWTHVMLLDIDGNHGVWAAAAYVRGTCEKWSSAAEERDMKALGIYHEMPKPPQPPSAAFP